MTVTKNGVIAAVGLIIAAIGIVFAKIWGATAAQITALGCSAVALGIALSTFISAQTSMKTWQKWLCAALIVIGFGVAGYSTLITASVATKIIGYVIAIIAFVAGLVVGNVTISSN
jgi:hypothetical protein